MVTSVDAKNAKPLTDNAQELWAPYEVTTCRNIETSLSLVSAGHSELKTKSLEQVEILFQYAQICITIVRKKTCKELKSSVLMRKVKKLIDSLSESLVTCLKSV